MALRTNTDLTGGCHGCKKLVTKADYCVLCKDYICDRCRERNVTLPADHVPDDHLGWNVIDTDDTDTL